MRFMMSSDEKQQSSDDVPAVVIAQSEPGPAKMPSRKKYTIIAVVGVVVVALVLTAILVGVYMFTDAQKELVQVTLQLKNGMTQDVTGNPNTNTVQFHVQETNQETWMINDYNSDLKVLKIKTATETNCFVTPLNESAPVDVPKMKSLGVQENADSFSLGYSTNGQPIKDTLFLSKTARDSCNGISTYWLYPRCDVGLESNTTVIPGTRQRRYTGSSYWDYYYGMWCAACGNGYHCRSCYFVYSCFYDNGWWFFWWC